MADSTRAGRARRNARYGYAHQQLRKVVAAQVAAGGVRCWRCGQPIDPAGPFDLGHREGGGADEYAGPEHPECGRATYGRERPRAGEAERVRHDGCANGCCPRFEPRAWVRAIYSGIAERAAEQAEQEVPPWRLPQPGDEQPQQPAEQPQSGAQPAAAAPRWSAF